MNTGVRKLVLCVFIAQGNIQLMKILPPNILTYVFLMQYSDIKCSNMLKLVWSCNLLQGDHPTLCRLCHGRQG